MKVVLSSWLTSMFPETEKPLEPGPEAAISNVPPLIVKSVGALIRNEEEGDEARANEVYEEDIEDTCLAENDKINKVEGDVEEDEEHLQRHETYGPVLETKETERQSLQGIQGNYGCHHH